MTSINRFFYRYVKTWGTAHVWEYGDSEIETTDFLSSDRQVLTNKIVEKECSYCRKKWREDSRGNCSSCGASG